MRLSHDALRRIRDTIEAEKAVGDSQIASDLQALLDFYLEHTKDPYKETRDE